MSTKAESAMAPGPSGEVNKTRRRILIAATSVVGTGAAVATAIPFIEYLMPSDRAKAAGAPVDIDISKLKKGQMMTVQWRAKPVWVLHRTQDQLETLPKMVSQLKDPYSEAAQQPPEMDNLALKSGQRSVKPHYLVLVGICTHLGCIPEYKPVPGSISSSWLGGYFCPCHGSRYDLSGRVIDGSPAPLNLPVPPYYYKEDTVIRVGSLANGTAGNWKPAIW